MENEIKVGEYGRTNLGNIIKFAWFQNSETGEIYKNKVILVDKMMTETYPFYYFKKDEYIVKHSPNLINLIECGDYVNGIKIISITQQADTMKTISLCGFDNDYLDIKLNNRDIKTVVTKEMMKSIEYKVK